MKIKPVFEQRMEELSIGITLWVWIGTVIAGWSSEPTFYGSKGEFVAALQNAQVLTQDFSGFASGRSMQGVSLVPGVSATSSFSNLVIWHAGNLFGYDNSTRKAGNGHYVFHVTNYNAMGFDVMAWNPQAPGPATAIVHLADGGSYHVERVQTGPTESTPVFFGVIAEQNIVRIEWHEGPEVDGSGNEEVSIDNLICAEITWPGNTIAGGWEPDVYTGHAARLDIRQAGNRWFVQGWGSCSPTMCDWGEVALERVTPHNPGAFDGWFAVWPFGFKTTFVWISFDGRRLLVESVDIFFDASGRQPYSIMSWMHQATPPPLPSAPVILTQPADQTVYVRQTVNFSVHAVGSPLPQYQWQKDGMNIPEATNATWTLATAQASDSGQYRVVVSNMAGIVTSSVAALHVLPAPASGTVAYVYSSDSVAASRFQAFLQSRGCDAVLLSGNAVAATCFSRFSLVVIGPDTGFTTAWAYPEAVQRIRDSGKPVLGLGEGGYAFFGRLELKTGYPHGWHGPDNAIVANMPAHRAFHEPHEIPLGLHNELNVYASAVNHVGIHLPTVPTDVVAIGREQDDDTHYSLTLEQERYFLWGYDGDPTAMTAAGRNLFENVLRQFHQVPACLRARLGSNGFELTVTGPIGRCYSLQVCSDLSCSNWQTWIAFTNLQTTTTFIDPQAKHFPHRLYRLVAQ